MKVFINFETVSRKFSASCQVFPRGCWNCILRVQRNISTKNCFISEFLSFLDTEQYFWPILEKKVAELSKMDSQFQWKLSGESFLPKLQIVVFFEYRAEKVRLTVGKSQRGFQAAFYFSIGTFWRKKFWKVFAFFVDFFGSIPVIEQEKFGRPVKTAFSVSIETFFVKKNCFRKQRKILLFSDTGQKFSASYLFFGGLVNTAFYVSIGTF